MHHIVMHYKRHIEPCPLPRYRASMIRTEVRLTEAQARRVKRAAAERGTSIAAVVRDAVEAELQRDRVVVDRALRAVGAYASGSPDAARRHDEYLGGP